MATTIFATGWEHQAPFTTNGGGLYSLVLGTWTTDTSIKHTGSASAKVAVASGAAADIRINKGLGSGTVVTATVYVNFGASLPGGTVVLQLLGAVNSPASNFPNVCYNPNTGFFGAQCGTLNRQEDNVTVQTNTWYKIDFLAQITGGGTNQTLDVKIDGRALTQVSTATTTTSYATFFLGTTRTDHAVAFNVYYDDLVLSATAADYPLSGTNQIGVQGLKPASDGTHNAGTNTMEDQAGNDINGTTVTAYNKINSAPPDATAYIRQATGAAGNTNYAEVLFEDITATHSAICCAMATLAYTSATTTANRGACIVSKDSFSTNTEVWGNPTTTQDYSDGATNNLFFKTAMVAGVVDDTTVNALKARVGYSTDASPNPYWIDLMVEVAYFYSTGSNFTQSVDGGITPAGTILRQANKTLAGGMTPSGTPNKLTAKTFSGAISSIVGTLAKQTSKTVSGAITSIVGTLAVSRLFSKILSGGLTPSGTVLKQTSKFFGGIINPTGAITKLISKIFGGILNPTGLANKSTTKTFTGTLTSSGGTSKLSQLPFIGNITPSGSISKSPAKALQGGITPSGTSTKQTGKALSGTLTSAGIVIKGVTKVLSGTLISGGSLLKQFGKSLAGTLTSAGTLGKSVQKILGGILTSAGTLATEFISGSGNLFFKVLDGTLSTAGSLQRAVGKSLSGNITPSGLVSRFVTKTFGGILTQVGTVSKRTTKSFLGNLTPSGIVAMGQALTKILEGGISFSGQLIKTSQKSLSGTLSSSGSMFRAMLKSLNGTLQPTGTINKFITKQFQGILGSSGLLGRILNPILATIAKVYLLGSQILTVQLEALYKPATRLAGLYKATDMTSTLEARTVRLAGKRDGTIRLSGNIKQ